MNCSTLGFFCPHSPWVCSNSCPLSQWCHPTISSSVAAFSLALSFSQHQGLFQWIGPSHQVAKVLEFQLQHHSFQWIFKTWFPLELTSLISLLSEGLSKPSPAPQFKSISSLALSLLYGPTLTSIHDHWKTIALTIPNFVSKVMSLLFNMLSRLVITFLPRSKPFLISWQ